jgi:DNA mismatch endonuclease (patch repair protein)
LADRINRERRSWNMSRIRSKDTKPEILLRKALHGVGFRYRLHDRKLLGSPDLVFPKYRAVIFVHGCFWHRHGCKWTTMPSSREDFWNAKFAANVERDKNNMYKLQKLGWRVLIVWECALKVKNSDLKNLISKVKAWLLSDVAYLEM